MPSIGILSFGTFADFKITNLLIKELLNKNYKVYHLTSVSNNQILSHSNQLVERFDISSYLDISNPDTVNQEISVYNAMKNIRFLFYLNVIFKPLINSFWYKCDKLFIYFSGLFLCSMLDPEFIESKKISILWSSPCYPSLELPWIFSKEKVNEYSIGSHKYHKNNYTSTISVYKIFSYISFSYDKIINIIKVADNYTGWCNKIFPCPHPAFKEIKIIKCGALINKVNVSFPFNNKVVNDFMFGKNCKYVYISFGSYIYKEICIIHLISQLISKNYKIIYHGKCKFKNKILKGIYPNHENILFHDSFIPHEWIIPRVNIVVTSGSLGMVSLANLHGIPLIYMPILGEQLFWAKVYQYETMQKYITKDTSKSIISNIINGIEYPYKKFIDYTLMLKKYLQKSKTGQENIIEYF